MTLQRVCLSKKAELVDETDDSVPDVQALIQELMRNVLVSTLSHTVHIASAAINYVTMLVWIAESHYITACALHFINTDSCVCSSWVCFFSDSSLLTNTYILSLSHFSFLKCDPAIAACYIATQ